MAREVQHAAFLNKRQHTVCSEIQYLVIEVLKKVNPSPEEMSILERPENREEIARVIEQALLDVIEPTESTMPLIGLEGIKGVEPWRNFPDAETLEPGEEALQPGRSYREPLINTMPRLQNPLNR
jgi:hypothetical protein